MKIYLFNTTCLWMFLFLLSQPVSAQVTRQPYLQIPTPTSVVVSWQSGTGVIGNVYYQIMRKYITRWRFPGLLRILNIITLLMGHLKELKNSTFSQLPRLAITLLSGFGLFLISVRQILIKMNEGLKLLLNGDHSMTIITTQILSFPLEIKPRMIQGISYSIIISTSLKK